MIDDVVVCFVVGVDGVGLYVVVVVDYGVCGCFVLWVGDGGLM